MDFVRVGNMLAPVQRMRSTCFSAGTLVRTQNGLKAIAALSGKDRILCDLNGVEVESEIQTVTKRSNEHGFDAIALATIEEDILVTPDHAVGLAGGGFAFVRDLVPTGGGTLRAFGGRAATIKVKGRTKLREIYNVVLATTEAQICYSVGEVSFAASDRL